MSFARFVGTGPIADATPAANPLKDPAGYRASPALARAVNVALALKMPLLVTGEPGTGKTQLSYRLAAELGLGEPLRFNTKTSSVATELFYEFDRVRQFAQSQLDAAAGRPLLAECGGLMVLFDTLATLDGTAHAMGGLLPGKVTMREQLAAIGLQSLNLPQGELRGHSFHYSRLDTPLAPAFECVPYRYGKGEKVYRRGAVTASYLHAYFPSNPAAAAGLLFPTA